MASLGTTELSEFLTDLVEIFRVDKGHQGLFKSPSGAQFGQELTEKQQNADGIHGAMMVRLHNNHNNR
jgi:hypothetical protein